MELYHFVLDYGVIYFINNHHLKLTLLHKRHKRWMTSEEIHPNPTQTFCITLRSKHPASFLCPTSLLHYCVSFSSGLLP